jgi:hypothetical protein
MVKILWIDFLVMSSPFQFCSLTLTIFSLTFCSVVAIEEQFPKDDEFRLLESKPSLNNSLPLHLEFETRSMPIEGIFYINYIFNAF